MQSLDDLLALLFHSISITLVLVQEALQVRVIREDLWTDEVQQSEQLLQVVLQWGSCDQQPTTGREGPNDLGQYGVDVLDAMRLINCDVFEGEFLERGLLDQTQLVCGDADFEVLREEPIGDDFCALLLSTCQDSDIEVWGPFFKLPRPILERRFWDDDQMRTVIVSVVFQVRQE